MVPRKTVLTHKSDFDQNGIFYHIGTLGGRQDWTNPHDAGRIEGSSEDCADAWDPDVQALLHPVSALFDIRDNFDVRFGDSRAESADSAWYCYHFPSRSVRADYSPSCN